MPLPDVGLRPCPPSTRGPKSRAHGLSVGLKNDLDQLAEFQGTFDFASR
jgi:hypothetical protein